MKRSEVNRDPEAAMKRARTDLRCAVRRLGWLGAARALSELADDERPPAPLATRQDGHDFAYLLDRVRKVAAKGVRS
jgi:hypothetical protein